MGKPKEKSLCKRVKHGALEEGFEAFKQLVANPTHICTKCGRVCNDKQLLCKPGKLD